MDAVGCFEGDEEEEEEEDEEEIEVEEEFCKQVLGGRRGVGGRLEAGLPAQRDLTPSLWGQGAQC